MPSPPQLVEIEGQRVPFRSGLGAGETARLVVRPEMIELSPASAGGEVVQHVFLGEKTDYLVKLGGSTLQATTSDHSRKPILQIGQPVAVRFDAEGIHVLG